MVLAGGCPASHFFSVCWKRSTLPWVCGWLGREWSNRTPRRPSSISRATLPPRRGRPVKTAPVVGEHAGGDSPAHEGVPEGADDIGSGDGASRDTRQGETGVVVEKVEDLYRCAVGEPPVSGVGLPALVGLFGFEPVPGRAWSLLRLGGEESAPGQDPPDRRDRGWWARHRRGLRPRSATGQVGADGVRAGVQS